MVFDFLNVPGHGQRVCEVGGERLELPVRHPGHQACVRVSRVIGPGNTLIRLICEDSSTFAWFSVVTSCHFRLYSVAHILKCWQVLAASDGSPPWFI